MQAGSLASWLAGWPVHRRPPPPPPRCRRRRRLPPLPLPSFAPTASMSIPLLSLPCTFAVLKGESACRAHVQSTRTEHTYRAHVGQQEQQRLEAGRTMRRRRLKLLVRGGAAVLTLMAVSNLVTMVWSGVDGGSSNGERPQAQPDDRWAVAAAVFKRQLARAQATDAAAWLDTLGSARGSHATPTRAAAAAVDSWHDALQHALNDDELALLGTDVQPAPCSVQSPQGDVAAAAHWLPCKLLLLQHVVAHLEDNLPPLLTHRPTEREAPPPTALAARTPLAAATRAHLAAYVAQLAHLRSGASPLAAAAAAGDKAAAAVLMAAALQAAEAAVDAGAAALGWQWQHVAAATAAARQQLGSGWRQPLGGRAACTDEFGLLRLLYEAVPPGPSSTNEKLGVDPPGSVVAWLESEQLGTSWTEWVAERPPYSRGFRPSSLADVSMAAGELAVLPDGTLAVRRCSCMQRAQAAPSYGGWVLA